MSISNHVCIIIPSKRPPPIATLENYTIPVGFRCVILADPDVYMQHRQYYKNYKQTILVRRGVHGLAAQYAECYRCADREGYVWYFRMDDDCTPGYFVHRDNTRPQLRQVISIAYRAAKELRVSLVGFTKSSNRFWMSAGFGRVFGLIHGGAGLFRTAGKPSQFIDERLTIYADVYQSCAHREDSGAVGRIREIGLNLLTPAETVTSGMHDQKRHERAKKIILARWSDYVTCDGEIFIGRSGHLELPWRFKRHATYRGKI
jgi:hypothetical protein